MAGRIRKEYLVGGAAFVASLAWAFWRRKPAPRMESVQVVVDPRVYMHLDEPQPVLAPARPAMIEAQEKRSEPYDAVRFGYDVARNEDPDITVDDYMNLPLEGAGLTHENRHKFKDLEEDSPQPKMRFQFFRFRVLETRDAAAARAAIGGFQLMNGATEVFHPDAKVWNPHTGERKSFFSREAWSDSDQKEFIVRFPVAVAVNRYKIQTSDQDQAFDPVRWRLEGSHNGAYWMPLDERSQYMPAERGVWLMFRMREITD